MTEPLSPRAGTPRARTIREMFSRVAPRYDLMNRVLSLGLDSRWRKLAARQMLEGLRDGPLLDLGCGSGDLLCLLARKRPSVGGDFCPEMLELAARRKTGARLVNLDASKLPFASSSLSGIASAFVFRNLEDRARVIAECHRCLLPGGRLIVLEFGMPDSALARLFFRANLRLLMPLASRLLSSDGAAYGYLGASIEHFGREVDLPGEMKAGGFTSVSQIPLMAGAIRLYRAQA
ncbi:MAG: ubiquinone/menaquinone biosynthesis methyltransferase [Planctomycetes bacterium]|nr:ubiquinone/menaquinone biosynthesis methyltransferase [Planctomycetota bacterium]